ncbi:MAG: ligand-binding sensor domain-containing protein [Bacteroidia bacterium]|jgi:ligand-binding sensor domain-containing protein
MRFRLFIILLWTTILFPVGLQAQNYLVEVQHFGMEDGLSSPVVNQITKDKRGFIWLATRNGLNRFDGDQFQVFKSEDSGLITNNIAGVLKVFLGRGT